MSGLYKPLQIDADLSQCSLDEALRMIGSGESHYVLHVGPKNHEIAQMLVGELPVGFEVERDTTLSPYEWFLTGLTSGLSAGSRGP